MDEPAPMGRSKSSNHPRSSREPSPETVTKRRLRSVTYSRRYRERVREERCRLMARNREMLLERERQLCLIDSLQREVRVLEGASTRELRRENARLRSKIRVLRSFAIKFTAFLRDHRKDWP